MNETDPFLWNLVNTNWTYLHNQVTEGSTVLTNNELIQLNEYLQAIIFSRKTLQLQNGTSSSGPSPTVTNTTTVATISDAATSATTASTATTAMIPASSAATTIASTDTTTLTATGFKRRKSTAPPPSTAAPLQTTTSSVGVLRPPRASLSAAPVPTRAQSTPAGAVSSSTRIAVQNSTAADIYSDSEDDVPVNTKKRARKDGFYTHALLQRSDVLMAASSAPHTTAPRLQPAPPKVSPGKKVYSYYNTDEVARLKEILPQYSAADLTGRKEIRSQLIQELNRTELSLLSKLRSMMDAQNLHPTAPPIAVPLVVEKHPTRRSSRVGEMERGPVVVPVPAKQRYRNTRRDQEDLEVRSFVDRNTGHTGGSSDRRKGVEAVEGWHTVTTANSAAAASSTTAVAVPAPKRMSIGTIVEREDDYDAYDYPNADIDEETEHSSSRSEGEDAVGNVSDDDDGQDGQDIVSEVVRSDAASKPKRKYTKKTQAPSPTTTAVTTTTTRTLPRHRNPTPFFDRDRGVLSNNYFKKYTDEENRAVEKYRKLIRLGKCTKAEAIGVLTQQLGRVASSVTTKLNAGAGRSGSKKRR